MLKNFTISENHPLALLSKNSEELIFVIAACYLLNIPFIPISPTVTERELKNKIRKLKPGAFFTDNESNKRIASHSTIQIQKSDLNLISEGAELESPSTDAESRFGYFFTSGTTGFPKIVPLLRRQIVHAAASSALNFKPDPNHFWLLSLPLNHVGGVLIILRSILYHSAIFKISRFDASQVRAFLGGNDLFQVASVVPTMLQRLLEDPFFRPHYNFKAMLVGGGPIPEKLIERSLERGIPVATSYGMTETCAQIAANPMLQPRGVYYPKKSVGPVFKPNKIQIRDPRTGQVQRNNEIGEIWLKGPQIFDGYLDKSLTATVFDPDGWFCTGDIGYLNHQKILFIKNRRIDRIISGGENVDPTEVELLLDQFDSINKSALLGVDDSEWGQKIVALIEVKNPELFDSKDINNQIRKKLSAFKIPKEYHLVKEVPTTSIGKIKRNKLFDLYQKAIL